MGISPLEHMFKQADFCREISHETSMIQKRNFRPDKAGHIILVEGITLGITCEKNGKSLSSG